MTRQTLTNNQVVRVVTTDTPAQVRCISPGGSARETFSLSRLTSRRCSRRARLFLILLRPTASTSIAPPEEPRITFSEEELPDGSSMYLAVSADRKDKPYVTAAVGRMKDPLFGALWRDEKIQYGVVTERTVSQAGEVTLPVLDTVVFAAIGIVPFDPKPDALGAVDGACIPDRSNGARVAKAGANDGQLRRHRCDDPFECER